MSRFNLQWKGKSFASPWKRIVSVFIDFAILSPPILLVAIRYEFAPFPGVTLLYWVSCSLWGWYTFLFGIGLPLYKGTSSIGDIVMRLGITDWQGRRISKLRLLGRQLTICFLLFWMLLPSFVYAGIVVNLVFYIDVFRKDKATGAYMHAVDRLFKTTVMSVEFETNRQ